MKMAMETIENGITRVVLDGRMDVAGTEAIDAQFSALAATGGGKVLVDMGGVRFIASIGMRTLLATAKVLSKRGGRMVLVNCQPLVKEALVTSGIATLIPVFDDSRSAQAVLQGPTGP